MHGLGPGAHHIAMVWPVTSGWSDEIAMPIGSIIEEVLETYGSRTEIVAEGAGRLPRRG